MKSEEQISEEWTTAHSRRRLFTARSFPRYLWLGLRESDLYRRGYRFWVYFRRYRLISRIITVIAALLTVVGTGAALLILLLLALLILPIVFLPIGGTMLLGWFRRGHQNRLLQTEVRDRTVYLFFPSEIRAEGFSAATMRQLAQRPQCAVFVISPYAWSTKGLGGNGFYLNARCESPHLFILRRHYFFFFKKLLTSNQIQRTVVIL